MHSCCLPPGLLLVPTTSPWYDGVDQAIIGTYLALVFGAIGLGYVFLFLDVRRYLRSLRRAMVLVSRNISALPYWALMERPACLRALDLKYPCSEEEVLAAYRERAKDLHPDRGGDLQQFLRLQKHFEEALTLARGEAASSRPQ